MGQAPGRFVHHLGQQHRIAVAVGDEHFDDRLAHIADAEGDPPGVIRGPHRHRLLEQGNAGLVPQIVAEEPGRVGAHRHHGRRDHLFQIEGPPGPFGADTQMNLKGGGGRFEHHVMVEGAQMFGGGDVHFEGRAVAHPEHLLVECLISLQGGDVLQGEVGFAHRGQDTDHHHVGIQGPGGLATALPAPVQLLVQPVEDAGAEAGRLGVEFDVEGGQLGHHHGVVEHLQQRLVDRHGQPLVVHQPGLQLAAGGEIAAVQPPFGQPLLQKRGLFHEPCLKAAEILFIEAAGADLLTHAAIPRRVAGNALRCPHPPSARCGVDR